MYNNADSLYEEIEKLRTTLNEASVALINDNADNSAGIMDISEKMDELINKYFELARNKDY